MKIAVVVPGMSGSWQAPPGRAATMSCVSIRTKRKSEHFAGKMPFYEPGLEELVRRNRREARLAFTATLPKAVRDSAIVFIAVGTPPGRTSADAQLGACGGARHRQGDERLQGDCDKSTVPVGFERPGSW